MNKRERIARFMFNIGAEESNSPTWDESNNDELKKSYLYAADVAVHVVLGCISKDLSNVDAKKT